MHNFDGNIFGMHFYWWLFIILIIIGVMIYNNSSIGNSKRDTNTETPLDILEKRFARGEITKEEFEERKAVLEEYYK